MLEAEITYKIKGKDFDEILSRRLEGLKKEAVLARYKDVWVSVQTVCEIHNLHRDTVIKYANANLIPHRHEGKLYKFSLAAVLDFDFYELKKMK